MNSRSPNRRSSSAYQSADPNGYFTFRCPTGTSVLSGTFLEAFDVIFKDVPNRAFAIKNFYKILYPHFVDQMVADRPSLRDVDKIPIEVQTLLVLIFDDKHFVPNVCDLFLFLATPMNSRQPVGMNQRNLLFRFVPYARLPTSAVWLEEMEC